MHVYRYTAGEPGLYVNSYLVELDEAVVAVDAGLLVPDAQAFRARLDALGKPLAAVLVTHAHPDHYNGVGVLVEGLDVAVHATADVARVIAEIHEAKNAQWAPVYGDAWPRDTRLPDATVGDGETLAIGGAGLRVHDLGPGESHAASLIVVEAPDAAPVAFIGDLAYSGVHAYNADGHSAAWLAALDRAAGRLAGVDLLSPGHGEPGGRELLAAQRRYQLMLREAVRNLAAGADHLDEAATRELTARMTSFLPGAPLEWLVGLSADPVAAELAAEAGPAAA